MMRHYETIYIVNPELSEEDYKAEVEKFNELTEKSKGVIVKTKEWGKQRLAYDIRKFDKGSYVYMEYCADAGVTAELERALKLDDRILKYQTVKLADMVDPEELLLKEKEAENKIAAEKEQQSAPEQAVKEDNTVKDIGGENGVSE
ncbi:30S ribosomal protein S6 [Thermodesulfobacteriota bacterium]